MALTLIYPQISLADNFTSSRVLQWSEESQNGLFQSSITMIGIVATQTGQHSHIARCIDQWYGDDVLAERQAHIREVMQLYPEHHPQAIILAVVQKACGYFGEN